MMLVRGLVKLIPAVARLFLPGSDWVLLSSSLVLLDVLQTLISGPTKERLGPTK